jgi:hypothetical protein
VRGARIRRTLRRSVRRTQQFFRATFARVRPDEIAKVETLLPPAQAALFCRMDRQDQRHCLDVYDTLVRAGYRDDELLRAALLHDVGKASQPGEPGRITVWHRVAIVLLQGLAPGKLERLAAEGRAEGRGWKVPFAVHQEHAEASAQLAAEAGCLPTVTDLIRAHHPGRHDSELYPAPRGSVSPRQHDKEPNPASEGSIAPRQRVHELNREERLALLRWADEEN